MKGDLASLQFMSRLLFVQVLGFWKTARVWGASDHGVQPVSYCLVCVSFSTCSPRKFLPRLYEALADELIESLAACHLRCVCGVAGEECELCMKYTALANYEIWSDISSQTGA